MMMMILTRGPAMMNMMTNLDLMMVLMMIEYPPEEVYLEERAVVLPHS